MKKLWCVSGSPYRVKLGNAIIKYACRKLGTASAQKPSRRGVWEYPEAGYAKCQDGHSGCQQPCGTTVSTRPVEPGAGREVDTQKHQSAGDGQGSCPIPEHYEPRYREGKDRAGDEKSTLLIKKYSNQARP
jgi:hypothetical protein